MASTTATMQRLLWRQAATRASARFCASASASTRSFVSSSAASRLSSSRLAATTKAATPISSPTLRSSPRRAYSSQPPPPNPNQTVKFWPFLIIIAGGFAGYAFLVKRRVGKQYPRVFVRSRAQITDPRSTTAPRSYVPRFVANRSLLSIGVTIVVSLSALSPCLPALRITSAVSAIK